MIPCSDLPHRLFALAREHHFVICRLQIFSAQNRKYCSISNIQTLEHSNTEHSTEHYLPMRRRILTPIAPAHTYTKVPELSSNRPRPSLPSLLIRQNTEHSNTQTLNFQCAYHIYCAGAYYTDTSNGLKPSLLSLLIRQNTEHSNTKHSPLRRRILHTAPAHTTPRCNRHPGSNRFHHSEH